MVLESITTPFRAAHNAPYLFIIGFLYASLALFLSYWIFRDQAGIVMVLLVVLASVPLFYKTMKYAEGKVSELNKEREILQSHARVARFFVYFFLGLILGFSLWYMVLPVDTTTTIFQLQTQTISTLNEQVTGGVAQVSLFSRIFLNNLKVMIFSLLFSFLFGSGAIFIISWNASVISAAFGNFMQTSAHRVAGISSSPVIVYLYAMGLSILRYFIHGIPEILAYFTAGLAGGILSVALIRGDLKRYFDKIMIDVSDLVIVALLFLIIAGLLEVFVTPLFFTVL